jgi:hypothetical protein
MMKKTTALACLLAANLTAAPLFTAQAEDAPLYDVEVIVFANKNVPAGAAAWEERMLVPTLENAISLEPGSGLPSNQAFYPLKSRGLDNVAGALRRSSRYEVLAHMAWRQPGLSREDRIGVQIRDGQVIPAFVETPSAADASTPMSGDSTVREATDAPPMFTDSSMQPVNTWPLNGTISVGLGRYLHVYTDLVYSEPLSGAQPAPTGTDNLFRAQRPNWQSYHISDHRRMRSRELHHLDHPKVGVLVEITPYEPDEAAAQ